MRVTLIRCVQMTFFIFCQAAIGDGEILGGWEGLGRSNWTRDFYISETKVIFDQCSKIRYEFPYKILKTAEGDDGTRRTWARKGPQEETVAYKTYYIKVQTDWECGDREYIMITIADDRKCHATVGFHPDMERMYSVSPAWHVGAVGREYIRSSCLERPNTNIRPAESE